MGFNTTVLVLNDYLIEIEKDKDFGAKLVSGILRYGVMHESVSVGNGTTVIESHHASDTSLVSVGANLGKQLLLYPGWDVPDVELLKALADTLGYDIRRKPKRNK